MLNTIVHDGDCLPMLDQLRPDLELLRWLARGSLKQNVLRAVRLWAWLRLLYGGDWQTGDGALPEAFTFADCRRLFFSDSHPRGEQVPEVHDLDCLCAKTTADWLMDAGVLEAQWRQDLQHYEAILADDLEKPLRSRLFAVTRRSLSADLQELAKLGWLQYLEEKRHYRRVVHLAYSGAKRLERLKLTQAVDSLQFLQPDLGAIAQNHAGNIRGVQRFFLHLDYIIPLDKLDQVDDWQEMLRQVWEQDPVSPLQLVYRSARHQSRLVMVVYPVCIYYVQRSVYLCGFSPDLPQQWYNFRLDRIEQCCRLDWADAAVPVGLVQCYQKGGLPEPSYIQVELDRAWGFDFYLPSEWMILRFNRDFHDRYIQDTFRHSTFRMIDRAKVVQLVCQHGDLAQRKMLMDVLGWRRVEDVYYRVCYRDGDTNIRHRLRAWRPHVEVLLPWGLRCEVAEEVWTESQFYQEQSNVSD